MAALQTHQSPLITLSSPTIPQLPPLPVPDPSPHNSPRGIVPSSSSSSSNSTTITGPALSPRSLLQSTSSTTMVSQSSSSSSSSSPSSSMFLDGIRHKKRTRPPPTGNSNTAVQPRKLVPPEPPLKTPAISRRPGLRHQLREFALFTVLPSSTPTAPPPSFLPLSSSNFAAAAASSPTTPSSPSHSRVYSLAQSSPVSPQLPSLSLPAPQSPSTASCVAAVADDPVVATDTPESPPTTVTATTKFERDFEHLGVIGSGSFATVHRVRCRHTGQFFALKRTKRRFRGTRDRRRALQEIVNVALLMQRADVGETSRSGFHHHCVKYHKAWQEDGQLYIQMELCNRGSLKDFLDSLNHPLEEQYIWELLADVIKGLHFLHSNNIIHMDIKPANIFIADDGYKIGDLGLSVHKTDSSDEQQQQQQQQQQTRTTRHRSISDSITDNTTWATEAESIVPSDDDTPSMRDWDVEGDSCYMSPELLQLDEDPSTSRNIIKPACDIFSLGASLFEISADVEMPSGGLFWQELRKGQVFLPAYRSSELQALIRQMMDPNPEKRPTTSMILEHPLVIQHSGAPPSKHAVPLTATAPALSPTSPYMYSLQGRLDNNNDKVSNQQHDEESCSINSHRHFPSARSLLSTFENVALHPNMPFL